MKALLTYCISCFLLPLCAAQSGPGDGIQPPGGGGYSQHSADVFSLFHNQAALSQLTKFSAGIYAERRFMLQAMGAYAFGAALPADGGVFGLSAASFGYKVLSRRQAGLAYAMHLGKYADIGFQVDYRSTSVHAYGEAAALTAEAGLIVHIASYWHLGLHAFNPSGTGYRGLFKESVPVVYTMGIGYEPSQKVLLRMKTSWDSLTGLYGSLIFQYRPVTAFAVQSGFSTDIGRRFLGIRLYVEEWRIDLSAGYHPELGVTPAAGMVYQL